LFHGFVVVFDRAPLRFLVAPRQFVHQPSHMVSMVLHAKLCFDKIGNALGRPQLRAVSVGHGALEEVSDQTLFELGFQLGWPAGSGLGAQRVCAADSTRIAPAHDATGITTNPPRNFMQGVFLLK
jgi:hypothetical protein